MDEDERRRKIDVGRAKKSSNIPGSQSLASYRQKRAKGDGERAPKKTQKRKGTNVSQNDSSPQDCHVEAAPPSELDLKTTLEGAQKPEECEGHQNEEQKDQRLTPERTPSPVENLRDEELAALTDREQLKQLQQAVEKRNEIIAKLSSNLQEALASRDQVQLEAQSLAGQIQALQRQLHQTSEGFQRLKSQTGAEVQPQLGLSSQDASTNHKDSLPEGAGSASPVSQSGAGSVVTEADSVLHTLRAELEEERKNSQRIFAQLAEEMEKNQHVLSLLEKEKQGREEERKEREEELQSLQTELSQIQNQCLAMQQCKEEKEKLNKEVLELRRRLQEEQDSISKFSEEALSAASRAMSHEEEVMRLKEEHRAEVQRVRQLLDEREMELKFREEEVISLKASKNKQNQATAGFGFDGTIGVEEANRQSEPDQDDIEASIPGDVLMERYFSSVPIAQSQSSVGNASFEHGSQLDVSAEHSFELNSDVFGDQPLLSISNRVHEEENDSILDPHYFVPAADESISESPSPYPHNFTPGEMEISNNSEQRREGAELEKELLIQQCEELRDELALKERDLNVLKEEVIKSAEELEEARNRWSQVTEELRQALWELEEEKAKRSLEETSVKAAEQDNLKNKPGALLEGKEQENILMLTGEVDETSLLVPATFSSEEEEKLLNEQEKETLSSQQEQQELLEYSPQEIKQAAVSAKESPKLFRDDNQLQTLQVHCEHLLSELEKTKAEHKTTSNLLNKKTAEQDTVLKELDATRGQIQNVQTEVERLEEELRHSRERLESAEKEKIELESQISCLRQNLASLEEDHARSLQEREEHRKKEEEMDRQIKQIEQVLEEELEQFENILKEKDVELAEQKEKWEYERQEKEKELVDVRRLLEAQMKERENEKAALMEKQALTVQEETERLKTAHLQEIKDMTEKHQQEVSELKAHLGEELLKQQAIMEEEQKQQLCLIKQVTEREHERMVSELNDKHNEELSQLRTEVTLELRESLEAAHQAELQQAQAQKNLELEALRLSMTAIQEAQQLELSDVTKLQTSVNETWTQEMEQLQANHKSELEQIKQQNQEQHDRLIEKHRQEIDELKQQLETRVAQERASLGEIQAKETLSTQWQSKAEKTQTVLTSTQASLTETSGALTEAQSELQKTQARLEDLQEELKRAWADKVAATCSLEDLVCNHNTVLKEKDEQVQQLQEKEHQLEQEVLRLQEEISSQKQSSELEIGQLWTQLESMRASRQELGELKEQLIARSSRVDDIERLKSEFNEQKREIKEQNEAELESLRRYFEKRLCVAEESYREEIALLQLRLVEGALEESLVKTTDESTMSQIHDMEEKLDHSAVEHEIPEEMFDTLRLQLEERHANDISSLQSSLTLSFKEELRQARSDLTDRYYEELQEMKTRHALDLEQLRAKLSDGHLRDLTRVRLETAQHVEAEVEQRIWCHVEQMQTAVTTIHTLESRLAALTKQHDAEIQNTKKLKQDFAEEVIHLEEALKQEKETMQQDMKRLRERHETEMSALQSDLHQEMEKEKALLEKALSQEREKLNSLQATLDNGNKMKELTAVLQQQGEERLHEAQERFQEEKKALEQHLVKRFELSVIEQENKHKAEMEHEREALLLKHSQEMNTLDAKHKAQLDTLGASHRDQLAAMTVALESKHNADLVALEAALNAKRKQDLESLEAVFQETNRTRLEALEAELTHKHQKERDELEKRMLGNMDTLEATYLKEVQTLRDELAQLEERHRQDLTHCNSEHKQVTERLREDLRKELAQIHMEKFKAMAAELKHVHTTELAALREALDNEHCKALETLKQQVLTLEQDHSTALQELSLTSTAEKEKLIKQHQLQLQELKGISARELEACRRELEEESSRQRQHFVEEVELLKVQSEERLQDRINQLKTESEEQKEAELERLRRSFRLEQEEKEQSYTVKMSQLTAQLQQLDAVVAQLRSEVGCLQGELEGKRAEMETLDTLLQRRERESQEGGNLLKMLTDDLQTAKEDVHRLHLANDKLKKVLIEMLHSIIATEELIGQKISARAKTSDEKLIQQRASAGNKDAKESGVSAADLSSEDLELTHLLCESLLVSDAQINPAGEEASLNACSRLRHTVDTLLDLLNQANTQLEQTHHVHLSLEEKFSQGKEDSAQLLEQHKLLLVQLDQEAKQKSQLQLELHKAQGLLEGYVAEKAVLEESVQQREIQEERLVEELEQLKVKLHQMQGLTSELESLRVKHQELSEEHETLLRQKEHLSAGLGEREQALLAETERLTRDRLDLQRQAEKNHKTLSLRLRHLERELEEQETKGLKTELDHKTTTEDLSQQVHALEKQLKHDRQFIEEQAVEREHERDEFQQEIRRLEALLKQTNIVDNKGHRFEALVLQVESLQAVVKDKTDEHASLLAANQQAQRDLAERDEEIDKLAGRIRELEEALLNSAESNRSVTQLEQELHRAKLREQELLQDKQALEQQQLSNRLQISALQSKVDETRHCYHDNVHDPTQELRDAVDAAQQSLQIKEQEVDVLVGQLESVQRDLSIKEVELKHLTLQLELLTNKNTEQVNELQEQIAALKENVSALTIFKEEKEGQREMEETEEETLPSALLQEKNQEIDHLNCEIQRLEQELENARNSSVGVKALEAEIEDLRSRVEHLQSEVTRVRQDKQEEEERLHEVISTLQAELATLGPNLCEVSDSQDGDSINPSPSPSPEPQHCAEQERRAGPNSLKHELSLTHAPSSFASSPSLRSHLKALQSQLETAVAEKAGLERLLLTQEEEYRGHGEEFEKRVTAMREKTEELQGLLILKEAELEGVRSQLEDEMRIREQLEEEVASLTLKAKEGSTTTEQKNQLNCLVLELQDKEQDRVKEIETLKIKEQETKMEIEALRETSLTLERQVQEVRAEVVDMEELVAVERTKIKTLETVKGELSAEREALRRREGQLREEIEKLRQESASMKGLIQDLTVKLNEKETSQEEAQKEVLTHAEVTLAKADAALREKEAEITRLRAEQESLRSELTAATQGLSTSAERAEKLQEEGQTKDQALVNLETDNQRLKAELGRLQEDLAVQEEELAYQQRELQHLRQQWHQQETLSHHQEYPQRDIPQRTFEDVVTVSRDEVSLSSPEILRKFDASEDRLPERFHTSVLGSRLSELSALNSTGLDLHQVKTSPRVVMDPPHSRTITPDPATQSTHSPASVSMSDNFSVIDSVDTDKMRELEGLDLTAPPSPLGSTSSLSAAEWASDGYGSNVSSELGARLRVELEQTERLDAQFIEYLRCRGMNPTANTDSAAGSMSYSDDLLSPELQDLLKKVYQESCRILTLSQRRALPSTQQRVADLKAFALSQSQHHSEDGSVPLDHQDKSLSTPPMSWQQEKRALQETVIALRELLCRMAQRHTQPNYRGDNNWGRDQSQIDGQVDSQLRTELQESQKQLKCAHDIQQEQKNKIMSLRMTVDKCEEALRREQARVQELQRELEQEQALSLRKDKEDEERREAVHMSSEKQKSEVMCLKGQLEQDKVAYSNLKQELQIEQSRSVLLEKRLDDTHKELEGERHRYAHLQELSLQDKTHLERLLNEAESRLADVHAKLADAHRKLDAERTRFSGQVDELSRLHEADAARDAKFISDLRSQLEQERRQGEELAAAADRLRAELMQSRRKWEEEERTRRSELQRLQEATARHRVAVETLKEQKREANQALEAAQELSRRQGAELAELKERLRLLKDKEREREEEWEREKRKGRQEQMERERRQERTNNKLHELELLRQQDQQRMQELQQTLAELERDEKEMAAQRLSGSRTRPPHTAASSQHLNSDTHPDRTLSNSPQQQQQQNPSTSPSHLLQTLLKDNSELTERLTSLSQERAAFKHKLSSLERQLRRTENELAKVTSETENRPTADVASNSKLQRLYERYLRAESFRKALVYQKRYLLLLLGGFQDCEEATLCLLAQMGARSSPHPLSQRRPLGRFRAVVRVVIAVSRMRFLTRKWQKAMRRLPITGSVNGHSPGHKPEVLRPQQQPRSSPESPQSREGIAVHRETVSALTPPNKSPFRLHMNVAASFSASSQDPERSLTEYIRHLEKVQQRLGGDVQGSSSLQSEPK
ncbi:pericentrin isoform X2 [Salarias fasciatus]|uniref:pericentrin isoform X2 n=1 Tax=Salarias fasciatus TaxID=181472 RepID=UPI0011770552|nr:pericentrin-like isoform X2 [Salarias fasciatus]